MSRQLGGQHLAASYDVKDVVVTVDGLAFTVVGATTRVAHQVLRRQVLRREIDGEDECTTWTCTCEQGAGICAHISRAEMYYRNVLVNRANLKRRLKYMVEQKQPSPDILLLDAKRKIKLEDD